VSVGRSEEAVESGAGVDAVVIAESLEVVDGKTTDSDRSTLPLQNALVAVDDVSESNIDLLRSSTCGTPATARRVHNVLIGGRHAPRDAEVDSGTTASPARVLARALSAEAMTLVATEHVGCGPRRDMMIQEDDDGP
jgi:hypothetical protein